MSPVNSFPQQPENDLRIDTAWRENYSGASMNRKLYGLLSGGVYKGFDVTPKSSLTVEIGSDNENIALIETNGFSLTASMPSNVKKEVTLEAGKTQYIVLEAQYNIGLASSVGIFVRETVPVNAVLLAKVTVRTGATTISLSDIEIPQKKTTEAVTENIQKNLSQAIIDQSGKNWFIEQGFLVTQSGSTYVVKAGVGYVSGYRIELLADEVINVTNKPAFIYIDAYRSGDTLGEQTTEYSFVVSSDEITDYVSDGVQHYVCKIAQITDTKIIDLAERKIDANNAVAYELHYSKLTLSEMINDKFLHYKKGQRISTGQMTWEVTEEETTTKLNEKFYAKRLSSVYVDDFKDADDKDDSRAFIRCFNFVEREKRYFGVDGSLENQPEHLIAGLKIILTGKIYTISENFEIPSWVCFDGQGSVVDVTDAKTLRISPSWTVINRVSFVSKTKRNGFNCVDVAGTQTTDTPTSIFESVFFKGFNFCVDRAGAWNNANTFIFFGCRTNNCKQFLRGWYSDGTAILGGGYVAGFTADDLAFIENHGSLFVGASAIFTPTDDIQYATNPADITPRTHYRWFDNHARLTISDGARFGNELVNRVRVGSNDDTTTPQTSLCYNYANVEPTTLVTGRQLNANQLQKGIFVDNIFGFFRNVPMIKLFGMPASVFIKSLGGKSGGRYNTVYPSNLDQSLTLESATCLFELTDNLKANLKNSHLNYKRYVNYSVDLNNDLPIIAGSISNKYPLLDQLKRDTNGLNCEIFCIPNSAGTFAETYIIADTLPQQWSIEAVYSVNSDSGAKRICYVITKTLVDNGGVTNSQLNAIELWRSGYTGGITLGHNSTTTATSSTLTPSLIGIAFNEFDADFEKNLLTMRLL